MAKAPSANATDNHGITSQEKDNQDEGYGSDCATRKKFGPAASHMGGNPTMSGGINRPTKGRP